MPWIQRTVMPAIFLTYKGVTVYHVYADGDFADGPLAGMFTLYTDDDSAPFSVHTLTFPGGRSVSERRAAGASEREAIKQHLQQAIDLGVLIAPPCGDEPPMASEVLVQRSDEEIVQRLVFALVNEGARIVEEGIALRASDIDMVYLTGYGFPLFRGGPMNYADTVGLFNVVQAMKRFAKNPNDDATFWQPAPLLAKLAAEGKTFS